MINFFLRQKYKIPNDFRFKCTELFLSSPESNRLTFVSRMNHIRRADALLS